MKSKKFLTVQHTRKLMINTMIEDKNRGLIPNLLVNMQLLLLYVVAGYKMN